ncbi:MAG: hypothetical protein ACYS8I_15575 [Planctomycetota bacterium]|jgi:hypothetical protein
METYEKRFEDLPKMSNRARKEAEDFLNRWIDDSTKGWPLRPALVGCQEGRISAPMAVWLN